MAPSFQLPIAFPSLCFTPSPAASLRATLQLAASVRPCGLLPLPAPNVYFIAAPQV